MTENLPSFGPIPVLPPPEHLVVQPPPPPGPPFPVLRRFYETFGGQFEARVTAFIQALADFSRTVGVPAPVEDPLIEAVARNGGGFVVIDPPPPPAPDPAIPVPPRLVSKLLVVDRIAAAGKLRDAMVALRIGEPISALSDAELILRERWLAAQEISVDDQAVRAFLGALGLNADAVLA